jgi:hypothetical protein
MTHTQQIIGSSKLKVPESRFLLLTDLGNHGMTVEMNSEQSIPHQLHTHEQFALRNLIAFVSIASPSLQSPLSTN